MSVIIINGTLIQDGDVTCDGNITVTSMGIVIPVASSYYTQSMFSCQTRAYVTCTGKSRHIKSTGGSVLVDGLIDGDGGIQRWIHRTNGGEQWNLRIASGSEKFLRWLQGEIEIEIGARGRLHTSGPTQFRLKYGKMAVRAIVTKCYYEGCVGLQRKILLAKHCLDSRTGWKKSRTVDS